MESSTVAKQIKGWFFSKIPNILWTYPKLEEVYSTLYKNICPPPFFLFLKFIVLRRPWDFFQHRSREIGAGLKILLCLNKKIMLFLDVCLIKGSHN